MAGSDNTFEFSPKVKDFVAKAMQNKTGAAVLRPNLLPDPKRTEPFTKYDLSEFYQLRIACVRGTADRAVAVYDIKNDEVGKVCDAVLATAADQMRKGVAVDDPTHLLAPYLVSQRNRGYNAEDGDPVVVAVTGARATALTNLKNKKADDTAIMYDLRPAIQPTLWPKSVPTKDPLLLASYKGGAKDSGFTAAVAFPLATGKPFLDESLVYRATQTDITEESPACNLKNNQTTRERCASIGYSIGNEYMRNVRAKLR